MRSQRVKSLKTGRIYDTIKEASTDLGLSYDYLRTKFGRQKHLEILEHKDGYYRPGRKVKVVSTGQVFRSVKEAAETLGLSVNYLYQYLRYEGRMSPDRYVYAD